MEPAYRDDTVVIVSPAASIRRGDRVVVRTRDGEVMVKELKRRTAKSIELKSISPDHKERTLPMRDVQWIHRVVWASQ
jgi:phage repressor protein C with HTH and peptisase S24 domain